MKLTKGVDLLPKTRIQVLAAFTYRHLDTAHPNDTQWLEAHCFWVKENGDLAKRRSAEPVFLADWPKGTREERVLITACVGTMPMNVADKMVP